MDITKKPTTTKAARKKVADIILAAYSEVEEHTLMAVPPSKHPVAPHNGTYLCHFIKYVCSSPNPGMVEIEKFLLGGVAEAVEAFGGTVALPIGHIIPDLIPEGSNVWHERTKIRASFLQFLLLDYIDNGPLDKPTINQQ